MTGFDFGIVIVGAIVLLLIVCGIIGRKVVVTFRHKESLVEFSIESQEKRRSDSNDDSDTSST